jgi:hypothetical protein
MNWLATWLSRKTWFLTIHWMRRPWMRRLHMAPLRWMQASRHEGFLDGYRSQNRLARRIGLPLLKMTYLMLLAVFALQITYVIAIKMFESGWLTPPQLEDRRLTD